MSRLTTSRSRSPFRRRGWGGSDKLHGQVIEQFRVRWLFAKDAEIVGTSARCRGR